MSSTVLLSKGAGQIYIMTVMAEAAVADDGLPLLTVGNRRKCTYPKGKNLAKKQGTKLFLFLKNHTLRCKSCAGKCTLYFGHRGLNYDSEAISLTRK